MGNTNRLVGFGKSQRDVIILEREQDRDNMEGASRSRLGTVTVFRYFGVFYQCQLTDRHQ